MTPTTSYDGDEPMYESYDDDTDYEYSDNDTDYGNRGSGEDGCADFGCLIIIIFIVYALYKCCN